MPVCNINSWLLLSVLEICVLRNQTIWQEVFFVVSKVHVHSKVFSVDFSYDPFMQSSYPLLWVWLIQVLIFCTFVMLCLFMIGGTGVGSIRTSGDVCPSNSFTDIVISGSAPTGLNFSFLGNLSAVLVIYSTKKKTPLKTLLSRLPKLSSCR